MESLIRQCAHCDQQFHLESLRSWRREYCDKFCRNAAKSARQNVIRRGQLKDVVCASCGVIFLPNNSRQRHCTRKCAASKREKARKARHRLANESRSCLHCSGPIGPDRNRNAIYCVKCAKPESRRSANCQDCGILLPPRKRTFCPVCAEKTKHARNRAAQYNITLLEYRRLIREGRCDICSVQLKERMPSWDRYSEVGHIDHDHKTGAVRGYLCRHCNHMIGNAKDDVARLQLAIKYLNQFA